MTFFKPVLQHLAIKVGGITKWQHLFFPTQSLELEQKWTSSAHFFSKIDYKGNGKHQIFATLHLALMVLKNNFWSDNKLLLLLWVPSLIKTVEFQNVVTSI